MKKIVYKTETGIAIITPTNSGLIAFGIEGIAQKDIPRILSTDKQELWNKGIMLREEYSTYPLPDYKIIDESELPQDRKYRNAWKYDLTIDNTKKAEIDAERAKAAEKEDIYNLVKTMESKISA